MLSDEKIEKLLQPIINRQNILSTFIIQKISSRIGNIKTISDYDLKNIKQLLTSETDLREIKNKIAEITRLNTSDIQTLLYDVAHDSYDYINEIIDDSAQIDVKNIILGLVSIVINRIIRRYLSLSELVFMIKDNLTQTYKPMSIDDTYRYAVNRAIQYNNTKSVNFDTVMASSIQQIADSGLRYRITTEDGFYTSQTDVYLKQMLLNEIRDMNMDIYEELGRQAKSDGVEISVHFMSAPDHEPIQGHQFTNEEFEKLQTQKPFKDVKGNRFSAIARPISMWNCRHITRPIIVGKTKPLFSQAELDANIRKNAEGYTDSQGVHRTLYECTQEQRRMERKIRQAKREVLASKLSDNKQLYARSVAKLSRYEALYVNFSNSCKLSVNKENCKIY